MAAALFSEVVEAFNDSSLVSGVQQKVENLQSKFEAIQAVVVDARQISNKNVRRWLYKLKEVSYQMDAVLDEWNTAITLRSNLKLSGKVLLCSNSFFHSNQVDQWVLHRRIDRKIENLNKKLTDLSIEKEICNFFAQNVTEQIKRTTISSVDESEVYGQAADKEGIVKLLLVESSGRCYDVISIVGLGGIGKTTLAQLVYNDERVVRHFQLKIWVCVSEPFNVNTVAKAILEAIGVRNTHQLVEREALTNRIKDLIHGKMVFLVLDDVWTEKPREWEPLEVCLKDCAMGSKILVTTRKEEVANMMGVNGHKIIRLQTLSDDDCWSIFRRAALFDVEYNEEVKGIGQQIAQKCVGFPVVAKTLGRLMRFKEYKSEEWMKVLNSELWELGELVEDEVFVPLLLSYYDLPPLEKRCFLYCSCFPKDYKINRDELIQFWFSQDLLSSKKDYLGEGVDCFKNLVARYFFQDFEKDVDGNIIRCKMSDIMHDFLMFLTKDECINTLIKSTGEESKRVDVKAFHCTLVLGSEEAQIPRSIYNNKSLRTLSVRNLGSQIPIRMDLLLSLTCLRTLSLHNCRLKRLPKKIDKLIHLRYLSLYQPGSFIKLPETICNLVNLQTLDLRQCVRALPKRIGRLVNLEHLYVGDPVILPNGLRKLTSLKTLDCIKITTGSKELSGRAMKLEDLSKLNYLKGRLSIHIGKVEDVDEAKRAQLKKKGGLVDLDLNLYGSFTLDPVRNSVLLLEGLQPHPKLKHLQIRSYYGIKMFPSWMISSSNLKSLVLERCRNCEVLGPFGKVPSLESLTISVMPKVKKVGNEFLGIEDNWDTKNEMENWTTISFPKLKQLEFLDLPSWEEWESESCAGSSSGKNGDSSCSTIMPALVSLTIRWCNDLKPPLPAFLQKTPLRKLTIKNCKYLEHRCQEEMRTDDLIQILTSTTSESMTEDTAGCSSMMESTTSRDESSQYRKQETTPAESISEITAWKL